MFISFIMMHKLGVIPLTSSVLGCGWQMALVGFLLPITLSRVISAIYPLLGEKKGNPFG